MAGSMKEIKLRIRSVESTMQITKAMELVASSKLRRAKERVEGSRPYFETLYSTLYDIVSADSGFDSPYLVRRDTNRRLYIVIAGDRGLAGGYNSNILKAIEADAEGADYCVLPIGKKAVEHGGVGRAHRVADGIVGQAEAVHDDQRGGSLVHRFSSLLLVGSVDDLHQRLGVERSAADQAAVDVLVREQLVGVRALHRAAVLNGHAAGDARAVLRADE